MHSLWPKYTHHTHRRTIVTAHTGPTPSARITGRTAQAAHALLTSVALCALRINAAIARITRRTRPSSNANHSPRAQSARLASITLRSRTARAAVYAVRSMDALRAWISVATGLSTQTARSGQTLIMDQVRLRISLSTSMTRKSFVFFLLNLLTRRPLSPGPPFSPASPANPTRPLLPTTPMGPRSPI